MLCNLTKHPLSLSRRSEKSTCAFERELHANESESRLRCTEATVDVIAAVTHRHNLQPHSNNNNKKSTSNALDCVRMCVERH